MITNNTYEPRSPFSASQFLENSGVFTKESKTHWSAQKNLPWQVAQARIEAAAKQERAEIRESFRRIPGKSVFLVARKIKGNKLKAIGFTEIFDTFGQLKEFARGIGRQKIRMGAVVASV